jgi:hypothetical protein
VNWTAIGALGEVFGALAVVFSLIYVATQVRQNTKAIRGAATADAIAGLRDWNAVLISDPTAARIFSQGVEDMNNLDEDGRARFIVLIINLFKTFEDMHYQFLQGSMDPAVWEGWENLAALYLKRPGAQQYWAQRRQIFSRPFQAWVEGLTPAPESLPRMEGFVTGTLAAPSLRPNTIKKDRVKRVQ